MHSLFKACSNIQQNMVLVEMNVLLHLKLDFPAILSVRFSGPRNSILLPEFYIWCGSKVICNLTHLSNFFCLNTKNLESIRYIKILAAKSNSMGLRP